MSGVPGPTRNEMTTGKDGPRTPHRFDRSAMIRTGGNKFGIPEMLDNIRQENSMGIRALMELNARQSMNTMGNMMGNAGGVFMQGMGMVPNPLDNVGRGLNVAGQGFNVLRNEAEYAGPMLGQAANNVLGRVPGARSNPETDLGARTGRAIQEQYDKGKKFLNEFTGFSLPYMGNDSRSRVY